MDDVKSTQRKKNLSCLPHLPLLLIVMWLICFLPLYLPNMGGSGLKLPVNIVAWLFMALITALIWLGKFKGSMRRIDPNSCLISLGVLTLGIPLLYTSANGFDTASSRWGGLLGGVVFYISLLQYPLLQKKRAWIFAGILTAVAFQAVVAIAQLWTAESVPDCFAYPRLNNRPYGVFQQVNVLASFIATGLALTLMLFIFSGSAGTRSPYNTIKIGVLACLIVVFSALLVWLQSRIGWCGGAASSLLMVWVGFKRARKSEVVSALFLIVLAVAFASGIQVSGHIEPVVHTDSNHARVIMLVDTLKMIALKPLLGWGYGGFEYSFQHFRAAQQISTLGLGVVRHPHNEILLWWVEGGLIALAGILLLLGAGVSIIRQAWRESDNGQCNDQYRASIPLLLLIVLLPMVLHTQTEYPFWASTPHWTLFLIVMALVQSHLKSEAAQALQPITTRCFSLMMIVISLAAVALFSGGLYANLRLTQFERNQLVDISKAARAMKFDVGVNTERWLYDKNLHALMVFNQSRDIDSLNQYRHWAEHYLSRRVDRNVYGNLCSVLSFLKDEKARRHCTEEAYLLFPDDPRFKNSQY